MSSAQVAVHLNQPIGIISPELHGHFVEQLFDCVNDGLYDRQEERFRPLFVQKSAGLGLELLRWPGGCFAEAYRWRDGIGPQRVRPRTVTNRWGVDEVETHHVGTHEILDFCSQTGAKPWMCLNVASGSVREACEWFEYMTMATGTDLADERAANGRLEPWEVAYWGIGNECWDCGGKFTPSEYAEAYRRFESALPRLKGVPRRLIVGGPDGNKVHERARWTREVLERLTQWRWPAMHAVDLHFYTWGDWKVTGGAAAYDATQFSAFIYRALEIEDAIVEQRAILDELAPHPKLFVGEWGPWHPDANSQSRFFQAVTLRDALAVSATLDLFHNHCDKVAAATYTMLCNVLGAPFQTREGRPYLTPVYHVFEMHKAHRGGTALDVSRAAAEVGFGDGLATPGLSVSASRMGTQLTATLANLSPSEPLQVELRAQGGTLESPTARVLLAEDPAWVNDPDQPDRIAPRGWEVTETAGKLLIRLPAASLASVRCQIA